MRTLYHFCSIAAMIAILAHSLPAQDSAPIASLIYMHAPDAGKYVELEANTWKPVHAERINNGDLLGWYLYEVVMPHAGEYNYLVVEVYKDWAALEAPFANAEAAFKKVHGANVDLDAIGAETEKARTMVGQDYWWYVSGVEEKGFKPGSEKYTVIDWMDVAPGEADNYYAMEERYYKKVHQARVDSGKIQSWSVWAKISSSESPGSVDALTVADYRDWETIMNSYPENAWETAHPGMDPGVLYDKMLAYRTMTGSTVLRLVDHVSRN